MNFSLSDPIVWLTIAAILGGVELLTVASLAMGFAIAAVIVAIVIPVLAMADYPVATGGAILVWSILGMVFWIALSRFFRLRRRKRPDVNRFDSRESLSDADLGRTREGEAGDPDRK